MNEPAVLVFALIGSILGTALGAYLTGTAIWKGVVAVVIATAVQFAVGEFVDLENAIVSSLVFLAAFGLVGGRWGLGMTARQMVVIVIGSFLFAIGGGVAALVLFPGQFGP